MWQSKAMAVVVLSSLAISTQALAGGDRLSGDGYYVNAKVVRVVPIMRMVRVATPREVCWNEKVRHVEHRRWRHRNSPLPMIVGGVVGGVVGNQIGKRGGRAALTIAGTLIGAAVGHGVHNAPPRHHRPARSYTTVELRCEIQTDYQNEERIDGYRVTYRYHGRQFTTRTDHHPGRRVRVRVQVEPTVDYERVTRTGHGYRGHGLICDDDCPDT